MATLPKRQKPIAVSRSAWWPGGRVAQKAFFASPASTISTALQAAPTPRRAASSEPGERWVSASSEAQPRAGSAAAIRSI